MKNSINSVGQVVKYSLAETEQGLGEIDDYLFKQWLELGLLIVQNPKVLLLAFLRLIDAASTHETVHSDASYKKFVHHE